MNPLIWFPRHWKCWQEILHQVNAAHVVDYSGDVSIAFAAVSLKISYGGLMLNLLHQRYCLSRIDNFIIALMRQPGSKHYQGDQLAKEISSAYDVHLDASRDDSDEESGVMSSDPE